MDLRGRLGTEPGNQMNVPALGHREKPRGWGRQKWGGEWSHRHIMSLIALTFSLLPISLSTRPLRLCSHHQPGPQTLMCLSEKMPNHFNNISCHLCFHQGLGSLFFRRVNAGRNFRQTEWKCRVQPIGLNHVWRNVILEDTRAEWLDMGISYYAKRRVRATQI